MPTSEINLDPSALTLKEGTPMAAKKAQAMDRLVAKLTALRKTLRGEERALLDNIVLAATSEVTAHSKTTRPVARTTASKTSDMELHSANVRRIDAGSKTASKTAGRQTAGAADSKTTEPEDRQFLRITVQDGAYRVTIL
jgi:hypothetical protein